MGLDRTALLPTERVVGVLSIRDFNMRIQQLGKNLAARLSLAPKSANLAATAILAGGVMFAGSAKADTLLSEDFEGLDLGPFVSRANGDGTDFTTGLPSGWTRDTTTTPAPADTAPEYFGPQAFDVDSWIAEAGQDRNTFTKGGVGAHGTVLVFDPDQFDDQTGIEPDLFNVYASAPGIDLSNIAADSVVLNFDSSFRPYDGMTALVDVSFDGGATFSNLLTMDKNNSGGDSSLTRADESLSLPIANPDSGSLVVRFGMTNAGNDWWWAVDNVSVSGKVVPEPSTAALAGLAITGLAAGTLRRRK